MDADGALRLLGRYSRWQLRTYFVYAFGFSIPFAWMYMSLVFIGDTPAHRCALPPNATLNETIPLECSASGQCARSSCSMYVNASVDNQTQACTRGYWYDPASGYESTLVTEWDLVCGSGWLVELSMTIGMAGSAFGALLFPRLSDMYGRKKIFLVCLWSNISIAVIMAFSPNLPFYMCLAFVDGFQQQGMVSTAGVLAVELFPAEQRTFAGNCIELFWALGYILLTPIAYWLRNWRHLQLAISVPLLGTVSFYWLIAESIPWLVANGRHAEAQQVLEHAAKVNGSTYPAKVFEIEMSDADTKNQEKGLLKSLEESGSTTMKVGVRQLLTSSLLRKYMLILIVIWFVNGLEYYAINFTVTYLPGDRYLNFFLYALLEVPAYLLAWLLMYRIGRIIPLCLYHVIGGLALIATIIQTFEFGEDMEPLILSLNMIGKFCITCSFATIYVNTIETFPTNIRNTALGVCQLASKIGMYLGPFARTLYRSWPWVPPLVCGVLSVLVGVAALWLPETRATKLPDTVADVEQWHIARRSKHKSVNTSVQT